jgi:hypothetical protein
MNITIDLDRFDELQIRVLEELIVSIRDGLRSAGVNDDQALYESTGNIAFSVAAIFDGSRAIELDGTCVVPVLTFAKERHGEDLVGAEGGSWMHEYVSSAIDDVFDAEGEA